MQRYDTREMALAAVQRNGLALAYHYAAAPLKADREIVLAAVQQNVCSLRYAAVPLKADREFMLAAVQRNALALAYAAAPLTADREIVLGAVQQNGRALKYAAAGLQADVQVVLAAVKSAGRDALEHVSSEMRDDSYLQRLAAQAGHPTLLRAFLTYARDLREANIKAKVDLWLTCHELHDWVEAAGVVFKRRKRARLDELGD